MKNLFKILCIFFALNLNAEVLTLERCYELAKSNYPMIKQFDLIKETEKYNLENAMSKYFPQLSIDANGMYLSDNMNGFIPQWMYRANVKATQTLWDGGETSANRKMTVAQAKAELKNNETILYQLIERVNQLYFGILLQDALLRQNSTYQSDIQNVIDKLKNLLENGVSNEYDLDLMKVELLSAKQTETEILATRKSFSAMLSALIGADVNLSTILEMPKSLAELKKEILRPELEYYESLEEYYQSNEAKINSSLMPTVSLFGIGGYGRPSLTAIQDSDFYGIAGVGLSWSFSNFYTQSNDKLMIAANKKSVRAQKETFLFNTKIAMIESDNEVQKFAELMKNDDEIIALRTNIKNNAYSKMQNGLIAVTDFIKELNAEELAKQKQIYNKIKKLSCEHNHKFLSNN